MMVIGTILAHEQTIYRTQRETYESRQILPGVSVRHLSIPASWTNQTLIDIDFRRHFDLNVIGLVEYRTNEGRPGCAWARPLPPFWKKATRWWFGPRWLAG